MTSKMTQAEPVEAEAPIKLEKASSEEQTKASESKNIEERSAQTLTSGEPESTSEEDEQRAFEKKKSKLNHAANQYKETSLRRSQ